MHLKPCPHRGPSTCNILNTRLGWRHGIQPTLCQACGSDPDSPALHNKARELRRFVTLTLDQAPLSVIRATAPRHPFRTAWWASKRWVIPYLLSKVLTFLLGEAPDIVVGYRLSTCARCPGRKIGPDLHSYCAPCQCGTSPRARLDGSGRTKLRHWYVKCPLKCFHPYRAIVRYNAHTSEYI